MANTVFAYTAPTPSYPEYVNFTALPAGVRVTVRGPASADGRCGETVAADLPPEAIAELSVKLLKFPPVEALKGAKPLVVYFANDADREEMISAVQMAKPGMVSFETP